MISPMITKDVLDESSSDEESRCFYLSFSRIHNRLQSDRKVARENSRLYDRKRRSRLLSDRVDFRSGKSRYMSAVFALN